MTMTNKMFNIFVKLICYINKSVPVWMLVLVLIMLTGILTVVHKYIHTYNYKLKKIVYSGKFVSSDFVLNNWIVHGKGYKYDNTTGLKYINIPGCYVIKMYKHRVPFSFIHRINAHENVYVGQSLHLTGRVYNHLSGKGKGDVYGELKFNKRKIYISFRPCRKGKLNYLEKKLIKKYNATQSYNHTKGGGKSW